MYEPADNCFMTGISKFKETPPIKKVNNGKIINKPMEIYKTGICFPSFSCNFLA